MMLLLNIITKIIFKIIIVFGLIFLDYIIILSLRKRLSKRLVNARSNAKVNLIYGGVWLFLILGNIGLLQEMLVVVRITSSPIVAYWNNSDLQIMILFYFLYMIRERIIVYIHGSVVLFLVFVQINNKNISSFYEIGMILIAAVGVIGISMIINKKGELGGRKYFVMEFLYSGSWGLVLFPIMQYSFISYISFVLNFILVMTIIQGINMLIVAEMKNYNHLNTNVNKDYLTQVGNRRAFESTFKEAFFVFKQKNLPFAFAMLDIDHFKLFNDNYGHLLGDDVIKAVAKISEETLDELATHGQVFRIGGEEFGIIFRNKSSDDVKNIIIKLCENIKNHKIIYKDEIIQISVSGGISEIKNSDEKPNDLYKRVDEYLYYSKTNGRSAITKEGELIKYD